MRHTDTLKRLNSVIQNHHNDCCVCACAIHTGYVYSPFGAVTATLGNNPNVNPFRFSSEFLDIELGLTYYNYRHYNPTDGRWLSRDPIEERGGYNLYGFLNNKSPNLTDLHGLVEWWELGGALVDIALGLTTALGGIALIGAPEPTMGTKIMGPVVFTVGADQFMTGIMNATQAVSGISRDQRSCGEETVIENLISMSHSNSHYALAAYSAVQISAPCYTIRGTYKFALNINKVRYKMILGPRTPETPYVVDFVDGINGTYIHGWDVSAIVYKNGVWDNVYQARGALWGTFSDLSSLGFEGYDIGTKFFPPKIIIENPTVDNPRVIY